MAKLSGMLGTMRGSLGGIAFTKSAAGPQVVMPRTRPHVDPASGAAYAIYSNRALIAYLSREWGRLEPNERNAWESWAATHPRKDRSGMMMILSGINEFVGLNHTRIRLNGAATVKELPPTSVPSAIVGQLELSDGALSGEIKAEWTCKGAAKAEDFIEIAKSGPYVSPGRSRALKWSSEDVVAGNSIEDTITGLSPDMWYWIRVRYADNDGQTTPWIGGQWQAST